MLLALDRKKAARKDAETATVQPVDRSSLEAEGGAKLAGVSEVKYIGPEQVSE